MLSSFLTMLVKTLKDQWHVDNKGLQVYGFERFFVLSYIVCPHYPYIVESNDPMIHLWPLTSGNWRSLTSGNWNSSIKSIHNWAQSLLQSPESRLVSFLDPLVFWVTFLVAWGGAILRKECHNSFKSRTRVSDASCPYRLLYSLACKSSRWPQSLLGQLHENRLQDKFSLFPICFKIRSLMSRNY